MPVNPKSLANLKQNRNAKVKKQTAKAQKEILAELDISEEQLQVITPTKELFTPDEQKRFMNFLKLYLRQFSKGSSLEVSDLVAISTLCKNHILEDNILKANKSDPAAAMASIEKLKKENAKLNDQLAATRVSRVDPRAGQDVTVQELVGEYDRMTKEDIRRKIREYEEEEKDYNDKISSSIETLIT